ncbi:MAG TPA: nicotinate phosphoribosyltransferase [Candidatus Binatia bacterium]|nr:nicotinate phosphoribosyltransferase [Candidatus Binatia bacterium]
MSTITSPELKLPIEAQTAKGALPDLTELLDYYKPTMAQLAYAKEPGAVVTFSLHNRGPEQLSEFVAPPELAARLEALRRFGWNETELRYLGSLSLSDGQAVFNEQFLQYLEDMELPEAEVGLNQKGDLAVETTGEWPAVTFWETAVLAEVNEIYFENYLMAHNLDPFEVYEEGDRRLSEKIDILKSHPQIKFADFGTRRHFSSRWQSHVIERLAAECPDNLVGTSNVGLARKFGLKPIGTFAHEMPMVYAGLAESRGQNIAGSHNKFLDDWYRLYGHDYSIALTDTFGSDFFFSDFSPEQAELWKGVRHDSGDAYDFGEKVIEFYAQNSIDPRTKTVVFSDGLDIGDIVSLQENFQSRINVLFGWGTSLTNDLGIKALNIVMKATRVNGVGTVKLSDDPGKYTGSPSQINKYKEVFGV